MSEYKLLEQYLVHSKSHVCVNSYGRKTLGYWSFSNPSKFSFSHAYKYLLTLCLYVFGACTTSIKTELEKYIQRPEEIRKVSDQSEQYRVIKSLRLTDCSWQDEDGSYPNLPNPWINHPFHSYSKSYSGERWGTSSSLVGGPPIGHPFPLPEYFHLCFPNV